MFSITFYEYSSLVQKSPFIYQFLSIYASLSQPVRERKRERERKKRVKNSRSFTLPIPVARLRFLFKGTIRIDYKHYSYLYTEHHHQQQQLDLNNIGLSTKTGSIINLNSNSSIFAFHMIPSRLEATRIYTRPLSTTYHPPFVSSKGFSLLYCCCPSFFLVSILDSEFM